MGRSATVTTAGGVHGFPAVLTSFIGRDGLLRGSQACRPWSGTTAGHQDLAQGAPVHAYLPPDRLRVLTGAGGLVPAPADEPPLASYSVGLEQG